MEYQFKEGELVVYQNEVKKEIGLVKRVTEHGCFVWYHLGGTTALTPFYVLKSIELYQMLKMTFDNDYVKSSLLERQLSMEDGRCDVTDLIDEHHVRNEVKALIKKIKGETQ